MTTVAYKDGVLAADTLVCHGNIKAGHVTKLGQIGPVLYGGAGSLGYLLKFKDWLQSGAEGEPPENEDTSILMASKFDDGQIFVCEWTPDGWINYRAPHYSIGSGSEIASTAMECGMSAADAVALAITRDIYSGGEVEYVSFEDDE